LGREEITMRAWPKIVVAAVWAPLAGFAAGLAGTVLDPHDLVVPNAEITLTCGSRIMCTQSDSLGRFVFPAGGDTTICSVAITRLGFAPYYEQIERETEELLIRLTLATVKETVTVSAWQEDAAARLRSSLASVSVSDDELKRVSNNTAEMIRYARLQAGATVGQTAVYVDGLPSSQLPNADTVAQITVNADPFSAEYADGDLTAINITTKGPARQLRFSAGGASLGAGGRDTLAPNLRSKATDQGGGVTGPIPWLPLAFSVRFDLGSNQADVPIVAVLPSTASLGKETSARSALVGSRSGSGSLEIYYSGTETLRAHLAYRESRSAGSNLGVGGLTLPEAGFGSSLTVREARATASKSGDRFEYRGGLIMSTMSSETRANSDGPGVTVLGDFVTGGAPFASGISAHSTWTWKNVFESTPGPPSWAVGITVSRSSDFKQDTPNPAGSFTFENGQAYTDALAGAQFE